MEFLQTRSQAPAINKYEKLVVCSNSVLDKGDFIVIGDQVPIQISKGNPPIVNLKAVTINEKSEREFILIVSNSVAKFPAVKVYEKNNKLIISVDEVQVLSLYESSPDTVVIDYVDLTPLGFNIKGTSGGLTMGGAMLSGNTIAGGAALIGSS